MFSGLTLLVFYSIMFVDTMRLTEDSDYRPLNFILLMVTWVFCLILAFTNIFIALYGFVCGCCYSHTFEELKPNGSETHSPIRIKSPFSFVLSNKVSCAYFHDRLKIWVKIR